MLKERKQIGSMKRNILEASEKKKDILCKEKDKIKKRKRERKAGVRGFFLIKIKRKRIVGENGRERETDRNKIRKNNKNKQ